MPDISALFKAKQAWGRFKENHPKFEPFMNAVKSRGVPAGSVIELEIKYPEGAGTMKTNLKVTESDLEILGMLKSLM